MNIFKKTILGLSFFGSSFLVKKVVALIVVSTAATEIVSGQAYNIIVNNPTSTSAIRKTISPNDTIAVYRINTLEWWAGNLWLKQFAYPHTDGLPTTNAAMNWIDASGYQKTTPMTTMLYPNGPIMQSDSAVAAIASINAAIALKYDASNPSGYISNYTETDPQFNTKFATKTTADLAENTNLYYTAARFNIAFGSKSTSDLTEGSNLYYTSARFNSALAAKIGVDIQAYNSNLGIYAGIAPSSNVQSLLGATNYAAIKTQLLLNNVDNTSDLGKPISTATQTALNLKQNSITTGITAQYFKGDLSLGTFPTNVSTFTNDAGYLTSLSGAAPTSRTISTTSPLTGGGDLSANRTFSIANAAANSSTLGAATFDADYFNDNGNGLISFSPTSGTGTISSSAVTINQPKGKITYNSPSIIAAGTASITLTNSFITSTSVIYVNQNGNGSNLTLINTYIKSQTGGSCVINIQNLSLLSLFNSNMVIDFMIIN